jgi:predicted SAM-dependent methyltransferase
MKLNLGCGNDIRSGYLNIDRLPPGQAPQDVYRQGDIKSLDWLVEEGVVDEIVALDCLEYLPINDVKQALINWAQKLTVGGILKILVPDCHAIAKSFAQGQFNLQEYSQMIFGMQEKEDNRLSIIDAATLLSTLQEIGLTISLKRYEGVAIYVEAIK